MTVYLPTIQIMKSETEELPFPFELKSVCSAKKMPNGLSERTVVIDITTHGPLDFQSPKKSPLAKTDGLGRKLVRRRKMVVDKAQKVLENLETKDQSSSDLLSEGTRKRMATQISELIENLNALPENGELASDSSCSSSFREEPRRPPPKREAPPRNESSISRASRSEAKTQTQSVLTLKERVRELEDSCDEKERVGGLSPRSSPNRDQKMEVTETRLVYEKNGRRSLNHRTGTSVMRENELMDYDDSEDSMIRFPRHRSRRSPTRRRRVSGSDEMDSEEEAYRRGHRRTSPKRDSRRRYVGDSESYDDDEDERRLRSRRRGSPKRLRRKVVYEYESDDEDRRYPSRRRGYRRRYDDESSGEYEEETTKRRSRRSPKRRRHESSESYDSEIDEKRAETRKDEKYSEEKLEKGRRSPKSAEGSPKKDEQANETLKSKEVEKKSPEKASDAPGVADKTEQDAHIVEEEEQIEVSHSSAHEEEEAVKEQEPTELIESEKSNPQLSSKEEESAEEECAPEPAKDEPVVEEEEKGEPAIEEEEKAEENASKSDHKSSSSSDAPVKQKSDEHEAEEEEEALEPAAQPPQEDAAKPADEQEEEDASEKEHTPIVVTEELSKSMSMEHDESLHLDELESDSGHEENTLFRPYGRKETTGSFPDRSYGLGTNEPKHFSHTIGPSSRKLLDGNKSLSSTVQLTQVKEAEIQPSSIVYGDTSVWMFLPLDGAEAGTPPTNKKKKDDDRVTLPPNFSKIVVILDHRFTELKQESCLVEVSRAMSPMKNEHFAILVENAESDNPNCLAVYTFGYNGRKCDKVWGTGKDSVDLSEITKFWQYKPDKHVFEADEALGEKTVAFSL